MNMKKYQEALLSLEQLHWHLRLNGGPDLWAASLLREFKAAANDNSDDEIVILTAESPHPAA